MLYQNLGDPLQFANDPNILVIQILVIVVVVIIIRAITWKPLRTSTKSICLQIAVKYERIPIRDLAEKAGMTEDDVIESIEWGRRNALPITIEGSEFVRLTEVIPSQSRFRTKSVVYLIICPHCGHKTAQGVDTCKKCGASL